MSLGGALDRARIGVKRRARALVLRVLRWEARRFDRSVGIVVGESGGRGEGRATTVVAGSAAEGIALNYVGQPPRVSRWWLRSLPERLGDFAFVDVGSGEGRVLFVAAEHGFRRIIGVEYVKENHERAVANVRASRLPAAAKIELVLGDARSFQFPDEPLVVHFANPFTEAVMERVLQNLTDSYAAAPRPIFVTYFQLREESMKRRTANQELLASASPFTSHRRLQNRRPLDWFLLHRYRVDLFESAEAIAMRES